MENVEIKWLINSTSSIYSYSEDCPELCFINEHGQQCTTFSLCKDYLQNAAIQQIGYEFNLPPNVRARVFRESPICVSNNTILAIGNRHNKDFEANVVAILDFLNQIEKVLKLKLTYAKRISNTENSELKNGSGFVLYGSSRWMLCPQMLSLYALLIRVGYTHKIGSLYSEHISTIVNGYGNYQVKTAKESDKRYLFYAKDGIDYLLRNGYVKTFGPYSNMIHNYKMNLAKSDFGFETSSHVCSGFVAWCSGNSYAFDSIKMLKDLLTAEKQTNSPN